MDNDELFFALGKLSATLSAAVDEAEDIAGRLDDGEIDVPSAVEIISQLNSVIDAATEANADVALARGMLDDPNLSEFDRNAVADAQKREAEEARDRGI